MQGQDKTPILSHTLKIREDVLMLAHALAKFYKDSDVDFIFAEAIRDAAKDKDFKVWLAQNEQSLGLPNGKKRGRPTQAKGATA